MTQIDHQEALSIEKQIQEICTELDKLSYSIGLAKQLIKYSRDRRKNLLAKYVALSQGESATEREMNARVDPRYLADLEQQEVGDLTAEQTLARESSLKSQLDAKRSLLSFIKAQMTELR